MSATIRLRNVSPLGHLDVPEIGREGPAPHYGFCNSCPDWPTSDHEHDLIEAEDLAGEGRGCLEPGEVFEVSKAIGDRLLEQTESFDLAESKKPARKRAAAKKSAPAKPPEPPTESDNDTKGGE